MLDKVVVLGDAGSAVAVELQAEAPLWQVRFKLWDADGRISFPHEFSSRDDAKQPLRWPLAPVKDLHGHTLTWSIRLSKNDQPASFAVRIRIMDGRELLPSADFVYSGPLDEFEERTGQFHFKVS
jgi:hypothetical protein